MYAALKRRGDYVIYVAGFVFLNVQHVCAAQRAVIGGLAACLGIERRFIQPYGVQRCAALVFRAQFFRKRLALYYICIKFPDIYVVVK